MADDDNDDAWLSQLRDALESAREPESPRPVEAFEALLEAEPPAPPTAPPAVPVEPPAPQAEQPAPTPSPEPEPRRAPDPEPAPDSTPLILEALASVSEAVQRLEARVETFETASTMPPMVRVDDDAVQQIFDQVELEVVVADAVRKATMKAQATGAGTVRLETEVRLLEQIVSKLSKQVNDVNLTALARDRLEKDVHVERLAEAAERVEGQLAAAVEARAAFDATVDKMLRHAKDGGGEDVAWTDVMFLAHELRSRVDDLDDQQRRAMRDLTEWQASMDDRLAGLRAQLLDEIRSLRDPVD